MVAWCEALKTRLPDFRFRVAAEDETPNITYSDQERSLMDTGRMFDEFGFRSREPGAVWAGFLDWVRRTPDFWKPEFEAPSRRSVPKISRLRLRRYWLLIPAR